MKRPVVSLGVSLGLVRFLAAGIVTVRIMLLHCWRISLVYLALKLVGFGVELGFSVDMEAFGRDFID